VTDVTVVSDMERLVYVHNLKIACYKVKDIKEWVAEKVRVDPDKVKFSAIVFNWCGAISKSSSKDLTECGISVSELV